MRRILCTIALLTCALFVAAPAANSTAATLQAPPPTPPIRTLTGILESRVFFRECHCYPWVIVKNLKASEMDISAVQDEANMLVGRRVKATGTWSTYRRDGRVIPYMIVTQLDPA